MNGIAIQYKNMLQKKWAQKLVLLLVSVTIVWQPQVRIYVYAYHYPLLESGMKTGL